MAREIWIVATTVGSKHEALRLAQGAVERSLAACAQIEPSICSVYVWQGKLKETEEVRILFKVGLGTKNALMDWIRTEHPYEVPEILAWAAESGNPAYTNWVENV